ncbi:hypothetical protein PVAP13_7KG209565 [Panicum virgatum]|uniref:Uncharacterized protein n=1 Tax=Panicum virgatum TaxID=38727 RepID=A0A8T0QNE6_PANVG|nr:hypothetical protein PVAP13_7KG209565 [Panicum virgatum]
MGAGWLRVLPAPAQHGHVRGSAGPACQVAGDREQLRHQGGGGLHLHPGRLRLRHGHLRSGDPRVAWSVCITVVAACPSLDVLVDIVLSSYPPALAANGYGRPEQGPTGTESRHGVLPARSHHISVREGAFSLRSTRTTERVSSHSRFLMAWLAAGRHRRHSSAPTHKEKLHHVAAAPVRTRWHVVAVGNET